MLLKWYKGGGAVTGAFASEERLSFCRSQKHRTTWIAEQQRAHCNRCRYGLAWEEPVVRSHSKHTLLSPDAPPFREEDESVTQRSQTLTNPQKRGGKRKITGEKGCPSSGDNT